MGKRNETNVTTIQWSDIDKVRFYTIGTAWYSAITVALHPVNVFKTRRQVLNSGSDLHLSGGGGYMSTLRGMYRGLGVVLVLAIPARGIYISVLEYGRDYISDVLGRAMITSTTSTGTNTSKSHVDSFQNNNQNLIASISGGLAGGLAGLSSQAITVPMDVISQRQMVMVNTKYQQKGDVSNVLRNILKNEGVKGLYRGMGISVLSSLPTGSLWWATYSGCQTFMQDQLSSNHDSETSQDEQSESMKNLMTRGVIQVTCGISAAVVAATMTQPLDVVRTRFQVSDGATAILRRGNSNAYIVIGKELYKAHGIRGFFKGTDLRVMNLGLWGTILSSAYEYLRYVSHKEYESNFSFQEFKMTKL